MEYILETNNLTKIYGQKEAAKDVNLHIREGQIYGLIGRNGAGKTTIMRMISGLSRPTRGSYSLFGKTGLQMQMLLKNVGVLIEHPGLYPRLSAYENLKIKCIGMGIKPKGYVEDLLKTVGLENTDAKKGAGSYSLGMRQRLGIALALVGDPRMIILDEPINGLDPQGIVEVREMLARLRDERGITIMISSHILDELGKIADAYGVIHEGKLLDEFSAEELHERCGKSLVIRTDNIPETLRVLDAMNIRGAIHEPDGSLRIGKGMDRTREIARAIVGAGIGLEEIYLRTMTLEEYYLGITVSTMGKLIRMDLYRMFKSRASVICLALALVLALGNAPLAKLIYMLGNSLSPEINDVFPAMVNLSDILGDPFPLLNAMLTLLSLCFFFYADVENGYIKNIAGQMPMKGFTVLSKFQASIVHNLIFAAVGIIGNLIGTMIVQRIVVDSAVLDSIRVLALKLLLFQSLCAILLLVVSTFRSKSLGMILAVLFGLGLTSVIYLGINAGLQPIFGEATDISKFMPDAVMGEKPLDTVKALVVAVVTGAIFLPLAIRIFDRKDVK